MNMKNIVKHKGEKINRFTHFISHMKEYVDIDNPKHINDTCIMLMSRIIVFFIVLFCSILFSSLTFILFLYTVGYVSVSISPILEYHTKNKTMEYEYHYVQDGALNISYIFLFILLFFTVYAGIIIPMRNWKKILDKEEKDLEVGNAID